MSRYEPNETTATDTGLADRLLRSGDTADPDEPQTAEDETPAPYEDDYLATPPRSKLTTALLVALIFLVGALAGTALTRALAPTPAPQIVYVLPSSSASPTVTR